LLLYLLITLLSVPISLAAPLSIQEQWTSVSDPLIMSRNFEIRLMLLPMTGKVTSTQKFWSGDYWALNKGIINRRWNATTLGNTAPPNRDQARSWTMDQLKQLSPSEKFDLFNGRYHYPLKREVENYSDYNAQYWEGICHGWAPASMNHNEPSAKTVKNPDGLLIPFGSADIKAVLSYFYAYPYQVLNTHQVGRRCFNPRDPTDPNCKKDLNAGAFHIILTNKIALDNEGFIADVAQSQEVWNHPIMQYESRVISDRRGARPNSAPGTTRTLGLKTRITYADEASNYWEAGTRKVDSLMLNYELEINAYGEIIGGEWQSNQRPDFLWLKSRPAKFSGNYLRLNDLLNE